jgi:hypothetical protein
MSAWLKEGNAVRILQDANDNLKRNVEFLQDANSRLRQCLADQRDLLGEAYCALQQTSDTLRQSRIAAVVCFIIAIVAVASRVL